MKVFTIAFDVDGTLKCSCTKTCEDTNHRVMEALYFFRHLKNFNVMIWSGGGVAYVEQFCRDNNISTRNLCLASKLDPNTWKWGQPDYAVDDQHGFSLAKDNWIVREK